jgi:Holliday junction resolvase-like predicted endonuclease
METRRYPVDKQTFKKIIGGNFVYVDKTDLVYKMTHDYDYVFLSRPRRFGKSLLCSTLKEYFLGNKDLFKGLKIDGVKKDWVKYPVINLSFASAKDVSEKSINEIIDSMLDEYEKMFAIERQGNDCGVRFKNLIINISQKTALKVVIIIDEYDAAMLDTINNDELQERIRIIQNKFFSPLKDLDDYIRFVFITGITKFSQMLIFSTLNNLQDISLMPEFETICGISHDELMTVLKPDIQNFAEKNGYTFENTVKYFKFKYDGYNFSPEMHGVFNPFSVIKALNDKQLNDYWFNSGTPTALLRLITKFNIKMEDYEGVECGASRFNKPVEKVNDLVPFLFQSGYLTIKNYKTFADEENVYQTYTLGYPNGEVRMAFANSLYTEYYKATENIALRNAFIDFKINDDLKMFIEALKKFFRRFPFSLNNMNEKHYHSILYTVLTSFGADISANQETALGKSDLILRMPKTIYVIELKYDRSTNSALDQIDDRDYVSAVLDFNKRIVKLAINFSAKDRNIESYEAVEEKNI